MTINKEYFANGVHFISVEIEEEVLELFRDISSPIYLNFALSQAIKVPIYFKEHRLSNIPSSIKSSSDHPNQLLSVALTLLEKTNFS